MSLSESFQNPPVALQNKFCDSLEFIYDQAALFWIMNEASISIHGYFKQTYENIWSFL